MPFKKKPARPTSYVALDETSRALMDSSVESAFVMDVSGYVLAANEAAAKLFDLKPGQTLQRSNIYELLPAEAAESRRAKIEEAIESVRSVRFEEEINGRSLVHSIVPVANPWGEVARLAVHTLDLTKLRRTDEDLRASSSARYSSWSPCRHRLPPLSGPDHPVRQPLFPAILRLTQEPQVPRGPELLRDHLLTLPAHGGHEHGPRRGVGLDRRTGADLPPAVQPHDRLQRRAHDHGARHRHHGQAAGRGRPEEGPRQARRPGPPTHPRSWKRRISP